MLLTHEKITKDTVVKFKQQCYDYGQTNGSSMLRERYIFMGLNDHKGFVCVEGNTDGWFIEGYEAGLSQAISWLRGRT